MKPTYVKNTKCSVRLGSSVKSVKKVNYLNELIVNVRLLNDDTVNDIQSKIDLFADDDDDDAQTTFE